MATEAGDEPRGNGNGHGSLESHVRDHPLELPIKSPHTILAQEINRGREELGHGVKAVLLSSLSAGLDLGFGPLAVLIAATATRGVWSQPAVEIARAAAYSLGFIFVVLGRTALFTEQTTLSVFPVLARRESMRKLMRLWGLCLAGNLAGAAIFAWAGSWLGVGLKVVDTAAIHEAASQLVETPWAVGLASAIGAGWLMGLLTWLLGTSRDTTAQIACVIMTTGMIGLAHLHHSVAGSVEVLMGVFRGEGATLPQFLAFLAWSTAGNAIGGASFVALLKFAYVREAAQS
jgi:formate/nitrite transporter FocA (FNT family)